MIKASVICLLLLCSLATGQQQLNFGVKNTVQSQLDSVLSALVNQLRMFNTSFQDNTRLQRQIDFTWETLTIILRELSPYNTVVQGKSNSVSGTKYIVLGSYNNVQGGSNWIFTNYYTGAISGDLVVDRYRVQMDKKYLTSTRPDLVVFLLTQAQTGLYSKYFGSKTNKFGSQVQTGVVSLFKIADIASKQIQSTQVSYQPPQPQPQQTQTQPQFQQTQSQFQSSQSQFQPFQLQFQPSQWQSNPFGNFQAVQNSQPSSGNGNLRTDGYVETSNQNLGGFTVSTGFISGSSGFFRV